MAEGTLALRGFDIMTFVKSWLGRGVCLKELRKILWGVAQAERLPNPAPRVSVAI